mgnify:CR=1 FL=1
MTLEGIRDGATFQAHLDLNRLNAQMRRVYDFMSDYKWHSLKEISEATGDGEASVSARLRDLRKERFGGFLVNRWRTPEGLFLYQLAEKGTML